MFNVVLVEPEIPNNTGNIGRTCVATGCHLHLIEPFGFELSDKQLKRAGLDYWVHLNWKTYKNFSQLQGQHSQSRTVFFSAHGKNPYFDFHFKENDYLVFGKESQGLDPELLNQNFEQSYYIPTPGNVRSLNLATAVAIVIYDGYRQINSLNKS